MRSFSWLPFLALAILASTTNALLGRKVGVSKCGTNEIFRKCSSLSEPKCEDFDDQQNLAKPEKAATQVCGSPKCQCKPGYIRKSSGKCVKKEECFIRKARSVPGCELCNGRCEKRPNGVTCYRKDGKPDIIINIRPSTSRPGGRMTTPKRG